MEDEKILSGYCRCLDSSRIVTVELEDGEITDIGCGYECCPHKQNCPIAKEIESL